RAVIGHAPPDPPACAEEVAAGHLREVLHAERPRHGEIDRLAARLGESVQMRLGELGQMAVNEAPLAEAQEHWANGEAPTRPVLGDEPLALERSQQPRRGALGQLRGLRELAEAG